MVELIIRKGEVGEKNFFMLIGNSDTSGLWELGFLLCTEDS
jgi:hypothetical protein